MSFRSRFQEKIDVLDIIIGILKDHEEHLSDVADRLDKISRDLLVFEKKMERLDRALDGF